MAKNQFVELLSQKDKGKTKTSGANGVLSRLFRTMLDQLNVTIPRHEALIHTYINDPLNGVPATKKDQTIMRGNLTKEFARPQMTWKVFMKGLRYLQIIKIELVIKAYHENGKISIHDTTVEFGSRKRPDPTFMERLDQPEEAEAVGYNPVLDAEPKDPDQKVNNENN